MTNLGAGLAVMRLFARVHSLMHSESGSLDELLSTVGPITHVRSDAAVNAL